MLKKLTLLIRRTPRSAQTGRGFWQSFEVEIPEQAYVLDALEAAWRQDSSLMFRHSCHHASCGSCGMRIEGREALACITPAFARAQHGSLHLEPLRSFPVLADLVVDTGAFAGRLESVRASALDQNEPHMQFTACIECGLCVSACPVSGTNPRFLGAAVLAAARPNCQAAEVEVLVNTRDGAWGCRGAAECTDVCPAGVMPALSIAQLRMDLIRSVIKRKEEST